MKIVKCMFVACLMVSLSLTASKPAKTISAAAVAVTLAANKKGQTETDKKKDTESTNFTIKAGNRTRKDFETFYTARKINEGDRLIMGVFENSKARGEERFIKAFDIGFSFVYFSFNGNFLAAACSDSHWIKVFNIKKGGDLTEIEGSPFKTGSGPRAISWKNNIAATCSWYDATISVFITDPNNGGFISLNGSPIKTIERPHLIEVIDNNIIVANNEGKPSFDTFTVDLVSKTLMRKKLFNLALPKGPLTKAEWQDD